METVLLYLPDGSKLERHLAPVREKVRFVDAFSLDQIATAAADASAIITFPPLMSGELLALLPRLRWIQVLTTGVDALAKLPIRAEVKITTATGVHAPQMAELVFFYMLCFNRDVWTVLDNQSARRWSPAPQRLLYGKTIAILGVGSIAEELAKRCQCFGMRVLGVSNSRSTAPAFDRIAPYAALRGIAAEADFLVVLAPYSSATHNLVDAEVIRSMKRDACLINVARGGIIDHQALAHALAAGRLRGAGLDVFAQEPLPPDDPAWQMPRSLITPHIGGYSDIFEKQVAPLLIRNIESWVNDPSAPLQNELTAGHLMKRRQAG